MRSTPVADRTAPLRLAALLALLVLPPAPARAELYRCPGPDGALVVTDDPKACPAAQRVGSDGSVTRHAAPAGEAPRPRPRAKAKETDGGPKYLSDDAIVLPTGRPARSAPKAADEQRWQAYHRQKQQERTQVDREIARLEVAAHTECVDPNGHTDVAACRHARSQLAAARERARDLDAYLAEGIEEDCRVAGCQPGWVR